MAWYNPATWSFVDSLQGQKKTSAPKPAGPDPNKVVGTINGRAYNYGGDWLSPAPGKSPKADPTISRLNAELRALQNQIAATPKIASFDIMGNWRKAQSAAQKAVNPLYSRKLNDFLKKSAAKKAQKKKEYGLNLETIGLEKTQGLEENQVARVRTGEDVAAAIDQVNRQEGYFQQDEGEQFDTEYRQMAEQLAAEGMATSGMGRQQTSDQVRLRNVQSQRQLEEFKGMREAKEIFKTRTFEDLARGDAKVTALAENKTKAAKFDLDSYLEDLAFDEREFRLSNEIERMGAVASETERRDRMGVNQFLAGLAGQGYSAADIAATASVYR